MGYSASPIFLLHGNPDKIVPKHNKFLNSSESYAIPYFSQRLCRWGVRLMPPKDGISHLTCTIFDPIYFGTILRNQISHISPTSLKKFIMGNSTSTSLLKSHTGATQALTRARERCFVCSDSKFVHLYCYFSVFGLWHKADFAHF